MSDWSWMRVDNRCNSLQYNAVHDRFGFQQQLLALHSTGKRHARFEFDPVRFHVGFSWRDIETATNHVLINLSLVFFYFFFLLIHSFIHPFVHSFIQVYVGQLSMHYEALSVEASKQTTAEEIVACIVERLNLTVNIPTNNNSFHFKTMPTMLSSNYSN